MKIDKTVVGFDRVIGIVKRYAGGNQFN
jgi:hypothetical protein